MGEDLSALGMGCLCVLVLALIVVAVLVPIVGHIKDAEAQRVQAEANLVDSQARADHLASIDWQHEFMLWTAWLERQKSDISPVGYALLGILAAVFVFVAAVWLVERRAR